MHLKIDYDSEVTKRDRMAQYAPNDPEKDYCDEQEEDSTMRRVMRLEDFETISNGE
jgi:hypothetical protein